MKRIIVFILLIISLYTNSFADIENDEFEDVSEIIATSGNIEQNPQVASKHAICIERITGRVLYKKSAYDKTAMASTTKIMTAILAIENCNLSDIVVISKKAAQINGSKLGLKEDMKISLNDLLYGLMLKSGNDAAIAIAEHVAGTTESFAILMNNKAKELNMKFTNFVTPNGLDAENHYSCAYDMAILTNYALNNAKFREIVSTKNINIGWNGSSKDISNTNELLGVYNGVYGVKTGFTFNAGRCLITACKRNDLDIIVVVLGADTKKDRTVDTVRILDYVYNSVQVVDLKGTIEESIRSFEKYFYEKVKLSKISGFPRLNIEPRKSFQYPLSKNELQNVYTKAYLITYFTGNWRENTNIGIIRIYSGDEIIDELKISLKNGLYKKTLNTYMIECLKRYIYI